MAHASRRDLFAGCNLKHLEEIQRLSSAKGTMSQVFIENVHYFPAESPGPDLIANQVE